MQQGANLITIWTSHIVRSSTHRTWKDIFSLAKVQKHNRRQDTSNCYWMERNRSKEGKTKKTLSITGRG